MHQPLSDRVGVMSCIRSVSRVLLFSLVYSGNSINQQHLSNFTTTQMLPNYQSRPIGVADYILGCVHLSVRV